MIKRRPQGPEAVEYFFRYINLVEDGDILESVEKGGQQMLTFLKGIDASKHDFAYEKGKWTLKESLIHVIDTERIMAYRALRIARGDATPMPGFDQDDYIPFYNAANRSWASVLAEYEATRAASLSFLNSLTEADFDRRGVASGAPVSVLALAYIIAGHELHHMKIIKERYL